MTMLLIIDRVSGRHANNLTDGVLKVVLCRPAKLAWER
jgi:hypothetical protein